MDNVQLEKKTAPTWFWVGLVVLILGAIIAYIIFTNDGRDDQRNTEEKTTGWLHEKPVSGSNQFYS